MKAAKILIVDDDKVARSVTAGLLRNWGYITETASNGMKSIEMSRRVAYDLIIMDIHMPDMTGIEAGQEITKDKRVPILYLTASAESTTMKEAIMRGGFGYLIKPAAPDQLKSSIESSLKRGLEIKSLNKAILENSITGAAVGILMERHNLSYEKAALALKNESRRKQEKTYKLSQLIITSTEEKNKMIRESIVFLTD